jgi:hypothetical protein
VLRLQIHLTLEFVLDVVFRILPLWLDRAARSGRGLGISPILACRPGGRLG